MASVLRLLKPIIVRGGAGGNRYDYFGNIFSGIGKFSGGIEGIYGA